MIKTTKSFRFAIVISTISFSCNKEVKVNDQFTIAYMEMYSSISLQNEMQGFVPNVTEAYWNMDSLVVSGDSGCFLLLLNKIEYNDEMIPIACEALNEKIKTVPIRKFIAK